MHKKSLKNILFSFGSQLIIIALGLFIPRLVMVNYGSDTNGYTATIAQIFTYMALLEAGIAQSTLNSLYGPVAKKDKKSISARMSASRKYYRKITRIYALLVILMSFILPFALNTKIDKFVAGQVVFFEGISNVIAFYYLESWKQLLSADGKYYVTQVISMIYSILGYIVKIILVCLHINIGIIQFAYFLVSLIQLMIYQIYLKKNYAWVDFDEEPDEAALTDRYSFMLNQVATTIFTSTDMIVLSIIGTTALASVYSVYGLIYNNLVKILNAVYFAMVYLLGQMWQKKRSEYPFLHDAFDAITHWLITSTMSIAYVLTIPFVSIYTSGVTDTTYIYKGLPLLFCLTQILSWNRYVSGNLTGIAGHAKVVSRISVLEAMINLGGSIILGNIFGIYGVLFATVIALPIKVVYCLFLSNKKIMKRKIWNSVKIIVINYILFFLAVFYDHIYPIRVSNYKEFIFSALMVCIIVYPLYLIINIVCNLKIFKHYVPYLKEKLKI